MRKLTSALLLALPLLAAVPASAQVLPPGTPCPFVQSVVPLSGSFEQVTVSTSSVGLTQAKYRPATSPKDAAVMAVVSVETNPIRYRDDGTAPTAAIGVPQAASTGPSFTICGQETIAAVRFIRSGGADATLNVEYYRRK